MSSNQPPGGPPPPPSPPNHPHFQGPQPGGPAAEAHLSPGAAAALEAARRRQELSAMAGEVSGLQPGAFGGPGAPQVQPQQMIMPPGYPLPQHLQGQQPPYPVSGHVTYPPGYQGGPPPGYQGAWSQQPPMGQVAQVSPTPFPVPPGGYQMAPQAQQAQQAPQVPVTTTITPAAPRHPLLEAMHRELSIAQADMDPVIVGDRRYLIRPHTHGDKIWVMEQAERPAREAAKKGLPTAALEPGSLAHNLAVQAWSAIMSIAAVSPLLTEDVTSTAKSEITNEDGSTTEVAVPKVVRAAAARQPDWVPLPVLFGIQLPPGVDPLDPPDPWREQCALMMHPMLANRHEGILRDLYLAHVAVMARTEVPQVPLIQDLLREMTT